jgi:hypothetical protein
MAPVMRMKVRPLQKEMMTTRARPTAILRENQGMNLKPQGTVIVILTVRLKVKAKVMARATGTQMPMEKLIALAMPMVTPKAQERATLLAR